MKKIRWAALVLAALAIPSAFADTHALIMTIEDGDTLDSILLSGGLSNGESATGSKIGTPLSQTRSGCVMA